MGIISDASPLGMGAVLVAVAPHDGTLYVVEAFEAKFTKTEAKLLGVDLTMGNHQARECWKPWLSFDRSSCGGQDYSTERSSSGATAWWP